MKFIQTTAFIALLTFGASSCADDKDPVKPEVIAPYTVPTTYNFTDSKHQTTTNLVKMWGELTAYTGTGSNGSATLDATKANNIWSNKGNPFADVALNTTGFSIESKIADGAEYKSFVDGLVATSKLGKTANAKSGTAGYVDREVTSNGVTSIARLAVDKNGLEYQQAIAKGVMGSLLFKNAVDLLSAVKKDASIDLQKQHFDEAFGLLNIPTNYDPTKNYPTGEKPLAWGGYLWERGRAITAGKVIFDAFLKGRAAIDAKDTKVRDEQIDIILTKWEQLAAAAAYNYVTSPQGGAVGVGTNPGGKLHALSEGYGFVAAFKYRPANSKLTTANYNKLKEILNTNFYTLLDEVGYPKLKEAQKILVDAYGNDITLPQPAN